ncbi:Crp/Fnr family transcriptional regulator [Actinomadura scrupuli]|uniref:Crp/Fnr family transcriptional regulator n=1 Tax=Actinomadura scrupuli TaxID=559629 RepID=UPI003D9635B0
MLALIAGRVKVLRTSPDGSVVVLAVRGPGELLGDISVLGGDDRSATVIALDPCEVRLIPAEHFLYLVRSQGWETQFLRHAMSRIREGEAWRAELATLPAGPRLARTLLRLAAPRPARSADVGLNQTELGQAAGLSRSTVAAELARLREQGIIATTGRRIVIIDLHRLRALADSGHGNV